MANKEKNNRRPENKWKSQRPNKVHKWGKGGYEGNGGFF